MREPVTNTSFARAGFLGNPSDAYFGKTISFVIRDYFASVTIRESRELRILAPQDRDVFQSIHRFSQTIDRQGFYGGIRLIKAAIKRLYDYCRSAEIDFRNFEVSYQTNIPRNVGMAGSSAIVTATLKALCSFFRIEIEPAVLASIALSAEVDLLGIPAGLQDRVIQCLEGVQYMDFTAEKQRTIDGLVVGCYEAIEISSIQNVYVAFLETAGEPTEVVHQNLRARFDQGDAEIVEAMQQFAEFADRGKRALLANDQQSIFDLINSNFDLRQKICHLHPMHEKMVSAARRAGASAKFCGSGGAIVGSFVDDPCWLRLGEALGDLGCKVLRPTISAP